jgi:tRNA(Ile)-lysidine synthase
MALLPLTLVDRVAQILTRYNMLAAGDRIGVAVSGGADSIVLLNVLQRLRSQLAAELIVLHVNHHLRGSESDEDDTFVRAAAASLGLAIYVADGAPEPGNLEQEARRARRQFFLSSMQQHGLQKLALGHTRGDQAETVLFRFLRGSGLAGLAGMQPVTAEGFVRPLLTLGREEIRHWARTEGITWREDSSNADPAFTRNRLRQTTIPALTQQYNPNLEGILAGTARLAQAEEDYWSLQIEPIYRETVKRTSLGSFCKTAVLSNLHLAVQRRLMRRAVADLKGDLRGIDLDHIDAILALCRSAQGHDRVLVPGVDALRSFGQLLLTQPGTLAARTRQYCFQIQIGEKCELPFDSGCLYVNWVKSATEICANFKGERHLIEEAADLDWDVLAEAGTSEALVVRNWQPGDEILRPGHRAPEKIKALFQENQVLLWERKHWPVVEIGNEIVWARKFGCAGRFKASSKSGRVVRLVYGAVASIGV